MPLKILTASTARPYIIFIHKLMFFSFEAIFKLNRNGSMSSFRNSSQSLKLCKSLLLKGDFSWAVHCNGCWYGGRGVTFLSGKACERRRHHGNNFAFLSGPRKPVFSTRVTNLLFYPDSKCFFIRVMVRSKNFRPLELGPWIKKRIVTQWNPDKKAILSCDWGKPKN